MRFYWDF